MAGPVVEEVPDSDAGTAYSDTSAAHRDTGAADPNTGASDGHSGAANVDACASNEHPSTSHRDTRPTNGHTDTGPPDSDTTTDSDSDSVVRCSDLADTHTARTDRDRRNTGTDRSRGPGTGHQLHRMNLGLREVERVLLLGITGSRAHGLATPESDLDYGGVYLAPTSTVLRLGYNQGKATRVGTEPDTQLHELGKFLSLALKGNPTVIEILYLNDYIQCEMWGLGLIEIRGKLHGQRTVRAAYGGYATHQAKRLMKRNEAGKTGFNSDLAKRTAKHGRHCFRLMLQAKELLETGTLTVDVSEHREELFAAGELAERDPSAFYAMFLVERARLDLIVSKMPDEPDWEAANEFLLLARKENW